MIAVGIAWLLPCALRAGLDPGKAITQYVHDVWTNERGLPQNSVIAIAQTPDGYIWLGTEEGLVRFDGIRFVTFDKRNTPELQSNEVDAILVDHRGDLWLGMRGGGLVSLRRGVFKVFTTKDGLSSDSVQALYEDGRGDLWIGTDGGGLNRLRNGKFSVYKRANGLANDVVFSLCGDGKAGIWIATHGGLSHWSNDQFTNLSTRSGLPSEDIRSLYKDRDGSLWMGTSGGGLGHLTSGGISTYTTEDGLSSNRIWSIFRDSSGSLWLGTGGGGICRFSNGEFSRFTVKEGFSGADVWAITEDREGSLWIGTAGGGLNRLRDASFATYGALEGLSSNITLGVYEDREGALWIGTADGGVDRLQNGRITNFTVRDGLPDNQVFSISEDGNGNHWFGTRRGLGKLSQGNLTVYPIQNGLSHDFVRCTFIDNAGQLWAGAQEGLVHFDGDRLVRYGTKDGLSDAHVFSIYGDTRDHTLWVGTAGGLNHLVDGRFRAYTRKDGLSSDVIFAMSGDADGTLWIATDGGGIDRFKDGKFVSYTTRSGMLDDAIFQLLDDGQGNLWMSCNRGVSEVSKNQLNAFADGKIRQISPRSFGVADGMRSAECNGGFEPGGWRLTDGRLVFPTTKGIVMVNPAHIIRSGPKPNVLLERIVADKREIPAGDLLSIPPGKGRLEFQYTATSFIEPNKIRFKYILEGFDKDWTEASARRTAYYTNIPPGTYRFHVVASNEDGLWSGAEAFVTLTLQPHFYQTLPFDAALGLAVAGLLMAAHRVRLKQLRARERKLEALVAERTEELSGSEKKFRQLAENVREVFWIMDPNTGAFLYLNPAFSEIWGFSPEAVLQDSEMWFTHIHAADRERVREMRHQQRMGTRSDCEYRVEHGGHTRWLWDRGFPVFDEAGRVNRVVGVVEDITARKEAEQILRRSRDELEERVHERTVELTHLNEALQDENQRAAPNARATQNRQRSSRSREQRQERVPGECEP